MLKISFIAVILATVSHTGFCDDVTAILGEMTPMAIFPALSRVPGNCVKYNITRVGGTCECGNRTGIPRLAMVTGSFNQEFVPIIAKNVGEVPSLLQYKECTCGSKEAIRLVYLPLNSNYIIQYEVPIRKYGENEANTAILIAKKMPTRAGLDSTIASLPDLRDRKYGLLCNV